MTNKVKDAICAMFASIANSESAMKRVLNPSADNPGTRVYPSRTTKNYKKYGLRLDKGHALHEKPNMVGLNLQANIGADDPTIAQLAAKNSHEKIVTVYIDNTQAVSLENLSAVENAFLDGVDEAMDDN
jgi:hypothetical protein